MKSLEEAWEKYWYDYLNCHKTQIELSAPSKAHFFNAYKLGVKAAEERAQVLVDALGYIEIEVKFSPQDGIVVRKCNEAIKEYKKSMELK